MPKPAEVQAALDMLFISKNLRWDMESSMWHQANTYAEAPSKLERFFGKETKPMDVQWTKREFDNKFRNLVTAALEQCEKVRKGKTLDEIYPVNANAVNLGREHWVVEIFMSSKSAERVGNFKTVYEANDWIRTKAQEYVVSKGLPKETRVLEVGREYY